VVEGVIDTKGTKYLLVPFCGQSAIVGKAEFNSGGVILHPEIA
jgi:hypothetical protein